LDSQPFTGVPADRHLTQSAPVDSEGAAAHRRELTQSKPAFVVDGLGLYNPALAITQYPDMRKWLANYHETARHGETIIYQRVPNP
jgi:hypothetical protein